jgi:hypothetical protein
MAKVAFIIGSNGPEYAGRLRYAEHDAQLIESVLGSPRCGFSIFKPAANDDTFDLRKRLHTAVTHCSDEDTFICYFSGHGSLEKGELFLLWNDTTQDLYATALPAADLLRAVRYCKAKNKLLILDCCHAGGAIDPKGGKSTSRIDVTALPIEPSNDLILFASGRLEIAREFEELGGSFLAKKIAEALTSSFRRVDTNRDGRISVDDLREWLEQAAAGHNAYQKTTVPIPYLFGQQRGQFYLTAEDLLWRPHSVDLSDGTELVILPFQLFNGCAVAVGKHPGTNSQYREFVKANPRIAPPAGEEYDHAKAVWKSGFRPWDNPRYSEPDQPVVCVSYDDCVSYTEWVQRMVPSGFRVSLPSNRVWLAAAYCLIVYRQGDIDTGETSKPRQLVK